MRTPRRAFTLVELLVVIGIIAVLIGILLPALASARRQAASVKCASALREIGTCFRMYEIDNRGYYPVARLNGYLTDYPKGAQVKYNIDGVDYPTTNPPGGQAYWFTFLAKYATKLRMGNASGADTTNAALTRNTIFFGCPAWEGYRMGGINVGDTNIIQTGYGMNPFPTFDHSRRPDPVNLAADGTQVAIIDPIGGTLGTWYKGNQWTHPSERMLVADSKFWLAQSSAPPPTGYPTGSKSWPQGVYPQPVLANSTLLAATAHQFDIFTTCIDLWRHGKYPNVISFNGGPYFYNPAGGKVSYNILYADGHVSSLPDGQEAYKSIRMKFPG